MITNIIGENEYEVFVYDWVDLHDDYLCGHIKRFPNAGDESDLRYWMFYPVGGSKPLMCCDLKEISKFISKLNEGG